jgi:DNA-binding NarL/FixJ family response regulator
MVVAGSPEASMLGSVARLPVVGVVAHDDALRSRIAAALQAGELEVGELTRTVENFTGVGIDVVAFGCSASDHDIRNLRRARDRCAGAPIVCLVVEPRWKTVRALLRDGAEGVVALEELEATLPAAVRAAHVGQLTLPSILRRERAQPTLSVREKQILAMVVMGFSNLEISTKLFVAESTVKSHLSSAFAKLGVRSRNEATALILDPASGLGTGILEISGEARRDSDRVSSTTAV